MRLIDADALKDKLQQHHDFYAMAWGGFGKMPIGEKKRVDEITNCIAEVVNSPTIEPKRGEWIRDRYWSRGVGMGEDYGFFYKCSLCEYEVENGYTRCGFNFCPYCGADMRNCSEKPNNCEEGE